jgi:O-antigen/teichoic acid export membrane protein
MVLSVIHVLGALVNYSAALIIAAFLPVSLVTMFAIAGNLCDYARQVASTISTVMMPRVSALTSLGSGAVGDNILVAARLATLVTVPIGAIFFVRGESFIKLWMGAEFAHPSGEVLRILVVGVLLAGARNVSISSIIGMNQHRTLIYPLALESISGLTLSILLVERLGLPGVAIGLMLPSAMINVWYLPRRIFEAAGVSVRRFYSEVWIRPLMACIPFLLANMFVEWELPAANLIAFFGQVVSTLPLVFIGAIVMCLSPSERKNLHVVLAKTWARTLSRICRR